MKCLNLNLTNLLSLFGYLVKLWDVKPLLLVHVLWFIQVINVHLTCLCLNHYHYLVENGPVVLVKEMKV